jgi:hypothetical protein
MRTRFAIAGSLLATAIALSLFPAVRAPGSPATDKEAPRPASTVSVGLPDWPEAVGPSWSEVTVYTEWVGPELPSGALYQVAGQDVELAGGSGTVADPYRAEVSLDNAIAELATDDLELADSASAVLSGKSKFDPVPQVALPPGATKKVYLQVVDSGEPEHYLLYVTRAATLTALQEVLADPDGLIPGGLDDYTPESVRAFYRTVLAAEGLLSGEPTQIEVDNGRKAILDAIKALDPLDPDAISPPPPAGRPPAANLGT